jgi:hypothetical protein
MKTMQEVVGALQRKDNFPVPVEHFLQKHTYEAFLALLISFCRGIIYELPEPCLYTVSVHVLAHVHIQIHVPMMFLYCIHKCSK